MMSVTKTVIFSIISMEDWKEQFNENENIGNNDNQIIQSSDDHSKDIANIVFQNIVDVLAITKQCKKIPDNQERFLRILFTIITSETLRNKFSSSDLGSKFGYYRKTIQKRLQQGLDYRNQIISGGNDVYQFQISQTREKKLSESVVNEILQFVKNHEHVRQSPNINDTLKINDQLVGKLILEISVNDLLMDLSKSGIEGILDDDGNLKISDTNFRQLLKVKIPELRKATEKHKQSCCCDTCLTMINMHQQLLRHRTKKLDKLEQDWNKSKECANTDGITNPLILNLINRSIIEKEERYNEYKNYCFHDNKPRYPKASDALTQIMCNKIQVGSNSYFQWPCVIGHCSNCSEYEIHDEEKSENHEDEIQFVHYLYHTRCTVHGILGRELKQSERFCHICEDISFKGKKGTICTKKEPVKTTCTIGIFMKDYYIPSLKRYSQHYPLMKILSKQHCGRERETAFMKNNKWMMRSSDFAEAFNVVCDNEIYESHYGNNPNIKCEGSDVVYHSENCDLITDFFPSFLMVPSNTLLHALKTCTSNLII